MPSFSAHAAAGGATGSARAGFGGGCGAGCPPDCEDRKKLVYALAAALFAGGGVPAGLDNPFELRSALPTAVLKDRHPVPPLKNIANTPETRNLRRLCGGTGGVTIGAFFLALLEVPGAKTA